jgi:hypothetical protein
MRCSPDWCALLTVPPRCSHRVLADNKFTGELPDSWSSLPELRVL